MSSIYEYEKNLVSIEKRIKNAVYIQENKDLFYKFRSVLFAESFAESYF